MQDPVFIHTLWRSRKTAFWALFRADPACLCYYEPLHDGLGAIGRGALAGAPDLVHRRLRHPSLSRATFAEYTPLLRSGGGIAGYDEGFAFDDFQLMARDDGTALDAYLRGLLDHAHRCGLRPVLGFSRSMLRIGWMRRLPGLHLAVLRDPHEQWASCLAQREEGNDFFLASVLLVFRKLCSGLGVGMPFQRRDSVPEAELAVQIKLLPFLGQEELYFAFYVVWWLCAVHARANASACVELGHTAGGAVDRLAALLADHGLSLDLGTLRGGGPSDAPSGAAAVEREARSWLASLPMAHALAQGPGSGAWLVSERVTEHVRWPSLWRRRTGARTRLTTLATAVHEGMDLMAHAVHGGRPRRETVGAALTFRWSATGLVAAHGCRLARRTEASYELVRTPAAIGCARTVPFSVPAGVHRIVLRCRRLDGGGPADLGVRVTRHDGGHDGCVPLTMHRLELTEQPQVYDLMPMTFGAAASGVEIGLHWRSPGLAVSDLHLVLGDGPVPSVPDLPGVYALGTELDFTAGGNAAPYLFRGFGHIEADGCWTVSPQADVLLPVSVGTLAVTAVTVEVAVLIVPGLLPRGDVVVCVNGLEVGRIVEEANGGWRTERFTCSVLIPDQDRRLWVSLLVPETVSPADLGIGDDRRSLGVRIRKLTLHG